MQEIEVKVENDHIERITTAKPIVALSELIWNAYDADATSVRVDFERGDLTKLAIIRVEDNGEGIPHEGADEFFKSLGGSWKRKGSKTKGGRFIHGERGQGRFKAFALGQTVAWISSASGKRFSITGQRSNLKKFVVSDVFETTSRGCTVEITDVQKDFEIRAEHGFADQVRDVFALQLYEDPSFEIFYDGDRIDAREAINDVTSYDIDAELAGGTKVAGKLEVVEWRKKVERRLMLCLPGRFSFHSMAPGIHARGFDFTAYLTADLFQAMVDENTEGLVELDPAATALIEVAKAKLREHFRKKEAQRSRSKIQEWKDAKIYPYEGGTADNPIERNERQVFDVVALNLADYSSEFDKAPPKQQKLILQLVKAAIETGTSELPAILENFLDLPKAKQEELADLLRKTTLTAVINAAKSVTNRLDFLRALQILVFDPKSKKQLLERSQLHRIIAQETWIFGEQYNLMNDDQDMTAVLRSHLKLLGRDELAPEPVFDLEGKAGIVDLMLSSRMPTGTDDERKHLVIELKRPSQPLNEEVIQQVKKYAKAVSADPRFKATGVEWDFWIVSNDFTRDGELEARQSGKPRGLVAEYDDPKIRVWAKTWGQVIAESEGRLTFYKRGLQYQANDEEALKYLRTINPDYLSEEVKAKIDALESVEAI